ncbi:MAG: DUF6361 family protein [Acidimicrobiia bacterium]|nr:DUF6361 family protein [Acidimicrobiia bacterium]
MASQIAWLDFSEAERKRVLDVIGIFNESDTRDELGIGAIRDTFAELLFPGTSTIQTRARYFFLVPWVFLDLERWGTTSRQARSRARDREIGVIRALEAGGESSGVIGIQAKSKLKRLPSSVYWSGLKTLGIRQMSGSIEDYFRSFDGINRLDRNVLKSDDGEPLDRAPSWWHPGLPEPPDDLLESAELALTRAEAAYLRERILTMVPGSMLAHTITADAPTGIDFPWQHPKVASFPDQVKEWLDHARLFSEVIQGAPLLYNLMLAERSKRDDLQDKFSERLDDWAADLRRDRRALDRWDKDRFWRIVQDANPRLRTRTKRFTAKWIGYALDEPTKMATNDPARRLILRREIALKGSQARLTNQRALEKWNEAAGTAPLNYRWPIAQRISNDIITGLGRDDDA